MSVYIHTTQLASSILPSPGDGLAHSQDGSAHIILSGVHQDSQVLRWDTRLGQKKAKGSRPLTLTINY